MEGWAGGVGMAVSSRRLAPGSIGPLAGSFAETWIPGTSPGMTAEDWGTLPLALAHLLTYSSRMNARGPASTMPQSHAPAPSPDRRRRYRRGHRAEMAAALMLRAKGYRIIARRLKNKLGEIDIVAVRGGRIAFVEVKARRTLAECEISITPALSSRVRRAAELWLAQNVRYQRHEQGYDVVFVTPWRWPRHVPNGLR